MRSGVEGAADRARTGTARITTSNAAVTPQPPPSGDDRTRTGGLSPDKRVLLPLSYAPTIARVGIEPTSRAHEAREESHSSTARRVAVCKWSGRLESNQRSPAPEAGGVADSPTARRIDEKAISRRPWNRTRSCSSSASRAATDTGLRLVRSSGGRIRTCVTRLTVACLAARPHRNVKRKERESNPQRPKPHPFSRRDTAPVAALPEWPRQESNLQPAD